MSAKPARAVGTHDHPLGGDRLAELAGGRSTTTPSHRDTSLRNVTRARYNFDSTAEKLSPSVAAISWYASPSTSCITDMVPSSAPRRASAAHIRPVVSYRSNDSSTPAVTGAIESNRSIGTAGRAVRVREWLERGVPGDGASPPNRRVAVPRGHRRPGLHQHFLHDVLGGLSVTHDRHRDAVRRGTELLDEPLDLRSRRGGRPRASRREGAACGVVIRHCGSCSHTPDGVPAPPMIQYCRLRRRRAANQLTTAPNTKRHHQRDHQWRFSVADQVAEGHRLAIDARPTHVART